MITALSSESRPDMSRSVRRFAQRNASKQNLKLGPASVGTEKDLSASVANFARDMDDGGFGDNRIAESAV
jgi:hypothetical protein